jgi:thiamine biosynthesis protein ThiS
LSKAAVHARKEQKRAYSDMIEETIPITVNGEPRKARSGQSIADFLAGLSLPEGKVAVEHNREIVPKSAYSGVALKSGDQLEIVHFVGGG